MRISDLSFYWNKKTMGMKISSCFFLDYYLTCTMNLQEVKVKRNL